MGYDAGRMVMLGTRLGMGYDAGRMVMLGSNMKGLLGSKMKAARQYMKEYDIFFFWLG
jgi:hypothetical protein